MLVHFGSVYHNAMTVHGVIPAFIANTRAANTDVGAAAAAAAALLFSKINALCIRQKNHFNAVIFMLHLLFHRNPCLF